MAPFHKTKSSLEGLIAQNCDSTACRVGSPLVMNCSRPLYPGEKKSDCSHKSRDICAFCIKVYNTRPLQKKAIFKTLIAPTHAREIVLDYIPV